MIARWWAGSVSREKGAEYLAYLEQTGVASLRSTPGNRGVYVFQREVGDAVESIVLSLWDSLDSIKAFAGDDVDRARYYPRDPEFLFYLSEHVTHFEAKGWLPPAAA